MRIHSLVTAAACASLLSTPAAASEFTFELDPERSRAVFCGLDTFENSYVRAFLNGTMTVDFDDFAPVPDIGTSPVSVPALDWTGTQDPFMNGEVLELPELELVAPTEVEPGVPLSPSDGFVDGGDSQPTLRLTSLRGRLFGVLDVNGGIFDFEYEFDQVLDQSIPGGEVLGTLSAPDGSDCRPGAPCRLTNDNGDPIMPLAEVRQLDCATELCTGSGFCQDFVIVDGDGDPVVGVRMRLLLTAEAECAADLDGDGFSPSGGPCSPLDCDDTDPAVYTGAPELLFNGIDENCDGAIDELPSCSPAPGAGGALSILPLYALMGLGIALARRRRG